MNKNRKPLFVANWKMNKTLSETKTFFAKFNSLGRFPGDSPGGTVPGKHPEVVICPPFTLLQLAVSLRSENVAIGAQDIFWEDRGAYTGEISPVMLKDLGCTHVIIGHSERRKLLAETDAMVKKKVSAALKNNLIPILCVGESLQEMEAKQTRQVVERQVREGLSGIHLDNHQEVVIAYEPIWAIGTGKSDSPEQSNQTIGLIRTTLAELFGEKRAHSTRILYGGSVKPENIAGFMSAPEIDGALVGGASLDPESFWQILTVV